MATGPIKSSRAYFLIFFLFVGIVNTFFSSCQKELSCENCLQQNPIITPPVGDNHPPVAHAGADTVLILPTITATLDGSGSTDPDGNITAYRWTKISGPAALSIQNAAAAQTQITGLAAGIYQFELQVTDAGNLSSRDTVSVMVYASLSGQEIIFNDLTWQLADFYGLGMDDIYVGTPARPDLFINMPGQAYNLYFPREVYIKFDTTSTWLLVAPVSQYNPNIPVQYVYDIISPYLFIHVYALNYHLPGRRASIKVKYL